MAMGRRKGVIAEHEEPTDEEVRRFDKRRKDKKVSNEEWVSPTDPDATITKMKDGTTHLAYKAEHVVDLRSDLILAAEIRPTTHRDTQTLADSVLNAEENVALLSTASATPRSLPRRVYICGLAGRPSVAGNVAQFGRCIRFRRPGQESAAKC